MKVTVYCEDAYEAQKLASLIYVRDSGESNIVSVLNTIRNELVIALKDGSAHSILLKDESAVESFADFVQSVIDREHAITHAIPKRNSVEIAKS